MVAKKSGGRASFRWGWAISVIDESLRDSMLSLNLGEQITVTPAADFGG